MAPRWVPGRLIWWSQVLRLPPRSALFLLRAQRLARKLGDDWTERSQTPPHHLLLLVRLARGKRQVVELGTASGWTAAILALADRQRIVRSFDPNHHPNRDRYLELAGEAQGRIRLIGRPGEEADGEPAGMLFVDSSHEKDATVREIAAWRGLLEPGAAVAFHDFDHGDFPGVAAAVRELGLEGVVIDGVFVWKNE